LAELRRIRNDPQFPAQVERLEATAWREGCNGLPPARGLEAREVDGLSLIIDRSAENPVNRLHLLGIDRPVSLAQLEKVIAIFAAEGVHAFTTSLLPTVRPTQAPRLMAQAGFQRGPQQAAVIRSTQDAERVAPFFRITNAGLADQEALLTVLGGAGDPPDWSQMVAQHLDGGYWRFQIAWEGSRPYAVGGFFWREDIALQFRRTWILPGFETRGVQTALIQSAVLDAAAQGCRWIVCIYPVTAETRSRRFERLGFEVLFQRRVYFFGQTPQRDSLADPLSRAYLH
jgi:hypothetical protein